MGSYVLDHTPDGSWYATPTNGNGRIDNVAGWQQVAQILSRHSVRWASPSAQRRFRSQFGKPPSHVDADAMGYRDG